MKLKEIKEILGNISFAPSNLDMGWEWQVKSVKDGFMLRCSFKRPDTNDGKMGTGFGRWMFAEANYSEKGILMTAWICAKLIVEHELMEAFLYKNCRILDPHKSTEELAYPYNLETGKKFLTDPNGNIHGAKTYKKPAKLAV